MCFVSKCHWTLELVSLEFISCLNDSFSVDSWIYHLRAPASRHHQALNILGLQLKDVYRCSCLLFQQLEIIIIEFFIVCINKWFLTSKLS